MTGKTHKTHFAVLSSRHHSQSAVAEWVWFSFHQIGSTLAISESGKQVSLSEQQIVEHDTLPRMASYHGASVKAFGRKVSETDVFSV